MAVEAVCESGGGECAAAGAVAIQGDNDKPAHLADTAVMGGHVHGCQSCASQRHYAYHSCHHKSCPQCGRTATAGWVRREQGKLIPAPYFMVTFTLPSELRDLFFGKEPKPPAARSSKPAPPP
jgi:hypothetical protein